MRSRERIIAAISAAIAAYVEEEDAATVPRLPPKLIKASGSWSSSGREQMMRMRLLWQRRVFPKLMVFGRYRDPEF
ncbi:MAG: hypothetical protein ACUVTR_01320 [Dehalococcoidia bacterium]